MLWRAWQARGMVVVAVVLDVCGMDMQRLLEAEPFLGYMGLEVMDARPGTAVLRLKLRREVTNHIGSVQGGAQYALGEATAIALAATRFPEEFGRLDLLTANATIAYHRLAHRLARGDLTSRAALPDEERERIRAEFVERGRARFPVSVAIADADAGAEGAPATTLTVGCAVRARR